MTVAPATRPDWRVLQLYAVDHLPRVLAGMGFTRAVGPLPWGSTPLFALSDLLRGWHMGRDRAADSNRARLHSPVRLVMPPPAPDARGIYVCETRGNWSDETGGARGDTLMDLGALVWGCRFGQAGFRIARLCGLEGLPHAR